MLSGHSGETNGQVKVCEVLLVLSFKCTWLNLQDTNDFDRVL